MIKFSFYY